MHDALEYRMLTKNGKPGSRHAIISRSSDVFDYDAPDVIAPVMRHAAMGLVQQMKHPYELSRPMCVWARRVMDSSDAVILVAYDLMPEHAAAFGFIPIAPCAH